jgi:hypothetical protein
MRSIAVMNDPSSGASMSKRKKGSRVEKEIAAALDRVSKKLDELEQRIATLELTRVTINPIVPNPPVITWPQRAVDWLPVGCPDGCQFPTHYVSPDGYYPCMKCGRRVFGGRVTFTMATPSVVGSVQ